MRLWDLFGLQRNKKRYLLVTLEVLSFIVPFHVYLQMGGCRVVIPTLITSETQLRHFLVHLQHVALQAVYALQLLRAVTTLEVFDFVVNSIHVLVP